MYKHADEIRELIEEQRSIEDTPQEIVCLLDEIEHHVNAIEKIFFNQEDNLKKTKRELNKYKQKYG